jgi:Transcriptional regulators
MSHYKILDTARLITSERRSSLTDQVYRRLRQDIIEGRWAPDDLLLESELAEEFDVSKTPVREALRLLVQEEWARVIPSRGYVVRPARLADVSELYELLAMIGPPLAGQAARRANSHDALALAAHVQSQRDHLGNAQASLDAARLFHLAMAQLARNHRADVIVERLESEQRRVHYLLPEIEARAAAHAEIDAHQRIAAAIQAGDAAASERAMSEHVTEVAAAVMSSFATARIGKYIAGSLAESYAATSYFSSTEEVHMRFQSAGVGIDYTDTGSGEPVVLVHGFGGSAKAEWRDTGVHDRLTDDFRVIAYDARGHGASDKPHEPAEYGSELALDIVRLLDHLSIDRAHVVGYSMGAHTTMHLLTLHPERVITATLGGAAGRVGWSDEQFARIEQEAREIASGSARTMARRLWPLGEPAPTDEELDAMSARMFSGKDLAALAAARRSYAAQVVTAEQVAAIEVPVLGIVGGLDPYVAEFRNLSRIMPSLEVVELDGVNHGTARTDRRFVSAIRQHLLRGS